MGDAQLIVAIRIKVIGSQIGCFILMGYLLFDSMANYHCS